MSGWKEMPEADGSGHVELALGVETLGSCRHFLLRKKLHGSPWEERAAENLEFQVKMDFGNFL